MRPTLLITPVLPWPPDQGNRRFLLDVARGFAELGPVTWVTREIGDQGEAVRRLSDEGFDLRLDRSFVRSDPVARVWRRLRIDLAAWRSGRPREVHFTCAPGVWHEARAAAADAGMAVAAFWYAAPALTVVPKERRVLVLSDVEHDRLAEARGVAAASDSDAAVARLRRAELEAWELADRVLCLTPEDRDRAAAAWPAGRHRLGVWPATHPVGPDRPALPAREGPLRLLTFGHWQADFNRDGLLDLVGRIWPTVRSEGPPCELRVVGGGLDADLTTRLQRAGCEVGGWAEDIAEELGRADAVVLHLTYGGGLRYRLLEAMAAGRPTLCGGVAARGAGAEPGRHYLAAEDPAGWVDALHRLHDDRVRETVAAEAWRFVVESYGPAGRAERLRVALASQSPSR